VSFGHPSDGSGPFQDVAHCGVRHSCDNVTWDEYELLQQANSICCVSARLFQVPR